MDNSYKICVCGSRNFNDYELLKKEVDRFVAVHLPPGKEVIIVSGMAQGADSLALRYAAEKGYKTKHMPAEWDKFGKQAGFIRNINMVNISDAVIAFHLNNSPGTSDMIFISSKSKKPVKSLYSLDGLHWLEKSYN